MESLMKYLFLTSLLLSSVAMAALSPSEQKRYERMRIMVNEKVIAKLGGEKPIRAYRYVKGKSEYLVESLNCQALVTISYKRCSGHKRGAIWMGPKCFDIKVVGADIGGCRKAKSCTSLLKRDGKCW